MMNIVYFEGVLSKVRQVNLKFLAIAVFAVASLTFTGCSGTPSSPGTVGAGDAAAKVNGKEIKMEAVEKAIKANTGGQETRLSPLELATARLQVLQQLIQQEVMYQKAEAEKTVPTDEEVTAQFNKFKTESKVSAEEFDKQMKEAGETEESMKERIKKEMAINKLVEKVTSKVEAPKDSEITAFFDGNKEAFVKRKGVKLAAIVVDPNDNGEGDTTKNPADAALRVKEIAAQLQQGADFATVAREKSEDASRANGGDLGYFSEDELKQNYPQLAAGFMDANFAVGRVAGPFNLEGRYYIFKLQERNDKEEALTLESPGVRQQITESLVNARKQLLSTSYATMAMNEAKVENYLAKKVIENPNELSGARPAGANSPVNTNANSAATANTNAAANTTANTPTNSNTNATAAKPAASAPANANTNTK